MGTLVDVNGDWRAALYPVHGVVNSTQFILPMRKPATTKDRMTTWNAWVWSSRLCHVCFYTTSSIKDFYFGRAGHPLFSMWKPAGLLKLLLFRIDFVPVFCCIFTKTWQTLATKLKAYVPLKYMYLNMSSSTSVHTLNTKAILQHYPLLADMYWSRSPYKPSVNGKAKC